MKQNQKINFSLLPFSKLALGWLFLFMALNFVWGVIHVRILLLPFILLALINIYATTQILRFKKQGFYILISSVIITLGYSIINHKSLAFSFIGFLCIVMSWMFIRKHWLSMK